MDLRDATPADITTIISHSMQSAQDRSEAEQRLVVQRLRATADEAPAYTIAGVRYPASVLRQAADQIEALSAPAAPQGPDLATQVCEHPAHEPTPLRPLMAADIVEACADVAPCGLSTGD